MIWKRRKRAACSSVSLIGQKEKDENENKAPRIHKTVTCNLIIVLLFPFVFVYRDAKCGKIQCQGGANRPVIGTNAVSIETNIPLQEGGRILCRGTHVYLGDDMPDPGLVLTGTKCGDEMVRAKACAFSLITFISYD